MTVFDKITAWLESPLDDSMSAFDWFLFCGLIIVAIILWLAIFSHIKD